VNSLGIWAVLGKLNHNLSAIDNFSIELFDRLLCLVRVFIPNKRETSRLSGPSVSGDKDVDDLAVLVEEREKIICARSESDVEDEERVGVSDVWRAGSPKVRHSAACPVVVVVNLWDREGESGGYKQG